VGLNGGIIVGAVMLMMRLRVIENRMRRAVKQRANPSA
jgi:hypothetical protein